jgi:hypothetical protein
VTRLGLFPAIRFEKEGLRLDLKVRVSQVWWPMPVVPALAKAGG